MNDQYKLFVWRERLQGKRGGKRGGKGWRMIIGASIFSQQNMHWPNGTYFSWKVRTAVLDKQIERQTLELYCTQIIWSNNDMLRYHYGAGHVTETRDVRLPPALARTMRPIVVRVLQHSPSDTPSPVRTNSSFPTRKIYRPCQKLPPTLGNSILIVEK